MLVLSFTECYLTPFNDLEGKVVDLETCCCWLVGWFFGFNGPLRQYFSLYRAVS